MKTAEEMFEELGYENLDYDAKYIYYRNTKKGWFVAFDLDKKDILTNKPATIFNDMECKEIQAINKQVEELGWIDER